MPSLPSPAGPTGLDLGPSNLLSPEVILHILEEVLHLFSTSLEKLELITARHSFLLSASLVTRSWTEPAKSLLFRDVFFMKEVMLRGFLENHGFGKYFTRSIKLHCLHKEITSQSVVEVVNRCEGLRKLELRFFGHDQEDGTKLPLSLLSSASLKDLTSLSLWGTVLYDEGRPPLTLPFSLHNFTFDDYNTHSSESLYPVPFYDLLSSHPLTSVHLRYMSSVSPEHEAGLVKFLNSVTPNLTTLKFEVFYDTKLSIIPTFSQLQNLKHLHLRCQSSELVQILTILPTQITRLSFRPTSGVHHTFVAFEKIKFLPSLSRLKELELKGRPVESYTMHLAGRQMVATWEKKAEAFKIVKHE